MCPVRMVDKILRLDTNVVNTAYNLKLYQGNSRGKNTKETRCKIVWFACQNSKKEQFL